MRGRTDPAWVERLRSREALINAKRTARGGQRHPLKPPVSRSESQPLLAGQRDRRVARRRCATSAELRENVISNDRLRDDRALRPLIFGRRGLLNVRLDTVKSWSAAEPAAAGQSRNSARSTRRSSAPPEGLAQIAR